MKSLAKMSFAAATLTTGTVGIFSSFFLFSAACSSTAQPFNTEVAGYDAVLALFSSAILYKGYKTLKSVMTGDNALDSRPSPG